MAEVLRPGVFSQAAQRQISLWLEKALNQWSERWFSAATKLVQLDFNQQLFGCFTPGSVDVVAVPGLVVSFDAAQLSQLIGGATGYPHVLTSQELADLGTPLLAEALRELSEELEVAATTQYVVHAHITVGKATGSVWIAPPAVQYSPQTKAAASHFTLSDAVADLPLTLQMQLPVAGGSLAQLKGLQVGTVLPLQHPVEKPLPVHCAGQPVFNGYLVEQNQTKALYLTSAVRHLNHDKKPTN